MAGIDFGTGMPAGTAFQGAYRPEDRAIERAVRARVRRELGREQGSLISGGDTLAAAFTMVALAVVFRWDHRPADGSHPWLDSTQDAVALMPSEGMTTLLAGPGGADWTAVVPKAAVAPEVGADLAWTLRIGSGGVVSPIEIADAASAGAGLAARGGAPAPPGAERWADTGRSAGRSAADLVAADGFVPGRAGDGSSAGLDWLDPARRGAEDSLRADELGGDAPPAPPAALIGLADAATRSQAPAEPRGDDAGPSAETTRTIEAALRDEPAGVSHGNGSGPGDAAEGVVRGRGADAVVADAAVASGSLPTPISEGVSAARAADRATGVAAVQASETTQAAAGSGRRDVGEGRAEEAGTSASAIAGGARGEADARAQRGSASSDDAAAPSGKGIGLAADDAAGPSGKGIGLAMDAAAAPSGKGIGLAADDAEGTRGKSIGLAMDDAAGPSGKGIGLGMDAAAGLPGKGIGPAAGDAAGPRGKGIGLAKQADDRDEADAVLVVGADPRSAGRDVIPERQDAERTGGIASSDSGRASSTGAGTARQDSPPAAETTLAEAVREPGREPARRALAAEELTSLVAARDRILPESDLDFAVDRSWDVTDAAAWLRAGQAAADYLIL